MFFQYGNSGDMFTGDLLKYLYKLDHLNTTTHKGRLLCVGSTTNQIQSGDILCGVGVKTNVNPGFADSVTILGLRGPISYDLFKAAGYNVDTVQFLLDPGLMLRFMIDDKLQRMPDKSRVIFIPHYRERFQVKKTLPKSMKFVDIDSSPSQIGQEILKSSLVYSSSLHGIIFAHALNRPCIFVRPQTVEPLLKFEDYYSSVGLPYKKPLESIAEYDFFRDSDTPPDLKFTKEDFKFPTREYLQQQGIIMDL